MFKDNLKNILSNLPLVLSDSQDPKDVSLNRIIVLPVATVILFAPLATIYFLPDWYDKLMPYWEKLLLFLGAQIAGNIFKKR